MYSIILEITIVFAATRPMITSYPTSLSMYKIAFIPSTIWLVKSTMAMRFTYNQ